MKLSDFLERNLNSVNKTNDFVTSFINELQNHLANSELNIKDGSKFVVTDINGETVSLVDISNGNELKVSTFEKETLNNIDLGSNIIFENNKFILTDEKFEITNLNAKAKLDDLYFNLEDEEGSLFSVKEIKDDKIYLTNTQEGGYFSISKEKYPDFKVGDILKKENGKYILE